MRITFSVAYAAMGVWLVLVSAIRLLLLVSSGLPLDPFPFIGGPFGVLALLLVLPRFVRWRRRGSSRP